MWNSPEFQMANISTRSRRRESQLTGERLRYAVHATTAGKLMLSSPPFVRVRLRHWSERERETPNTRGDRARVSISSQRQSESPSHEFMDEGYARLSGCGCVPLFFWWQDVRSHVCVSESMPHLSSPALSFLCFFSVMQRRMRSFAPLDRTRLSPSSCRTRGQDQMRTKE